MQLDSDRISFRYGRRLPIILKDVSLTVGGGERLGIVGPSGYGKSTFLEILAGYLKPTSGRVLLDGKPLPTRQRSPVQLINQHPEEAINPRWRMGRVLEEAGEVTDVTWDALGLEHEWLDRYPQELSGGEMQRFSVARALAANPEFILADEITAMLDTITQAQIWRHLIDVSKERGIGLVVVTHNLHLAERVCERIVDLAEINHAQLAP